MCIIGVNCMDYLLYYNSKINEKWRFINKGKVLV